MKRFLSIFIALALMIIMTQVGMSTAFAAQSGDYSYSVIGNSVQITAYTGTGGAIVIPDTLEGLPVTSIGEGAFGGLESLRSVTIPDSVTSIGNYAFGGCTGLISATISNSVTSIGVYAFGSCTSLTGVTLPDSVISIGDNAFESCVELTGMNIPGSVTNIGDGAFIGCEGLRSVTIPGSVNRIGNRAFGSCVGLTTVTIPGSVTSIGDRAFEGCKRLAEFIVDNNNMQYSSLVGVLFNKNQSTLIQYPVEKIGSSYIIPITVTSINDYAFSGCERLTSVSISDRMTSIGDNAFENCTGLTGMAIPDSVTSIGYSAFAGCEGLASVTIPDSVTSIGANAFYRCMGLTSVTIPNSVKIINENVFAGCTGLTNVTIPNSVTGIGYNAFQNCERLSSVTIPSSVTSISEQAFIDCKGLTKAFFLGNAPAMTINKSQTIFAGCALNFRVYFLANKIGFTTPTWHGYPSAIFTEIAKPLSVPTGLKAASSSYSTIKLTWNAVSGASGYGIYRSTSTSGPYILVTYTNTSANSYLSYSLRAGTTYYYKIRAYSAGGAAKVYGKLTSAVSAKPVSATPTGLKAAPASYNTIKLTWNAVSGASGYGIYKSTSTSGPYILVTYTNTSANSYLSYSLQTGTTYYYKIRAYRTIGTTRVYSALSAIKYARP